MKIAQASRLKVLTPGMILALLLFTAVISASDPTLAQETPRPSVQELTLEGAETAVVATTTSAEKPTESIASGLSATFTEFSLPKGTHPQLMATAPDGSIFIAQGSANKIAHIALPGSASSGKLGVREYTVPTEKSFPQGIAVTSDGIVWFTEKSAGKIARLDPQTGVITEFATPTPNSGPVGITVGPDGRIWFTEAFANKIGALDPKNPSKMEEFSIPTPVSAPLYVAAGPDGAIWFVGVRSHKLGRLDPATRAITEYTLPTPKAGPTSLVVGPDKAIWVTEFNTDKIARFDVQAKRFTDEIPVASRKNGARSGPGILINGPDGNIWFTELFGNQIARLNVQTRQIHEFSAPSAPSLAETNNPDAGTADEAQVETTMNLKPGETLGKTSGPGALVFSQDGAVWYVSIYSGKVARLAVK
jgi:virginiamycin B lyase